MLLSFLTLYINICCWTRRIKQPLPFHNHRTLSLCFHHVLRHTYRHTCTRAWKILRICFWMRTEKMVESASSWLMSCWILGRKMCIAASNGSLSSAFLYLKCTHTHTHSEMTKKYLNPCIIKRYLKEIRWLNWQSMCDQPSTCEQSNTGGQMQSVSSEVLVTKPTSLWHCNKTLESCVYSNYSQLLFAKKQFPHIPSPKITNCQFCI